MVWLPADHRLMGDHGHQMPYLVLGDKYARAVKVGAAQPVMFPLAERSRLARCCPGRRRDADRLAVQRAPLAFRRRRGRSSLPLDPGAIR